MSEILESLFNSKAEVKLLRLFLNNADKKYTLSEIAEKVKIRSNIAKKEVNNLLKIKFLIKTKKSNQTFYRINTEFIFYNELKKLIFKASPTSADKIASQVMKLGQTRFVLVSGAFLNSDKGKIDILIVGEQISRTKLKNFLSNVEADVGKGINYVCMSTDEFRYRKNMFDKFILNIFDTPHKILVDKMKKDV
ncbi:MAG: hypothetical protein KAI71_03095 [Candidatus Pacebacteria bacterium]|nr:hypothetical protein [Candidatus Paceibacterota bacterium]